MSNLENTEQELEAPGRKKISLEEAIKQKLASKKQNQLTGRSAASPVKTTQNIKSQQTKKRNNQRKRTGV